MNRATIVLPIPPSVNGLFRNVAGRGRVKTQDYVKWEKAAWWSIIAQCPQPRLVDPPYRVVIELETKRTFRGDLDNRIKPVFDALVTAGVMVDDKHVVTLTASRYVAQSDQCKVTVSTYRGMK